MNPSENPYAPGAGTPPPELAGRDPLLSDAHVVLKRVRNGFSAQGQLLLGLRGVGKTVLLNRIEQMGEDEGFRTVLIEAPEGRRLPELLVPRLKNVLVRLSAVEAGREMAHRAARALRSFAGVFKVGLEGFEIGIEPEAGVADSGQLEIDLPDLFRTLGEAARQSRWPVALLIDEVQYLTQSDLAALIVAMHRVAQRQLPVVLFGAGLPQLAGLAGEAKSYAERLFTYPTVGPLSLEAAREALDAPARRAGATYTPEALGQIVEQTQGYPYFLQEWGKHAWNTAAGPTINLQDVQAATERALAELDASFFRVRVDRLTPKEREYMYAMALLGPGPHRSGDVAARMGKSVNQVAPHRSGVIQKGMAYSPAHGDTAFTVPMFDAYLRRVMP